MSQGSDQRPSLRDGAARPNRPAEPNYSLPHEVPQPTTQPPTTQPLTAWVGQGGGRRRPSLTSEGPSAPEGGSPKAIRRSNHLQIFSFGGSEQAAVSSPKRSGHNFDFADVHEGARESAAKAAQVFDFADREAMKQKVRRSLLKPQPYSVLNLYRKVGVWQRIARSSWFETVTLTVVAANAIYMAVDTDYNDANSLIEASPGFQVMENLFCLYFSWEWLVRFMSFERKLDGCRDSWFVFDSFLVAMMVAETWVLTAVFLLSGSSSRSPLGQAAILRLFRLLRLSRLIRMLRSLPELMILIKGMMTAMKSVLYVMCLLVMITYVFAIAFTQLTAGTEMKATYFDTVPLSMFSLVVYGTFLDNLAQFCDDIRAESPLCCCLVFVFIGLACLTVLNMLIGVLCEVVSAVAATEKEERLTSAVIEKMQGIVQRLDTDFNGRISYVEFCQIMSFPEALQSLEEIGVDPVGIVDFAEQMFFEEGRPIELQFDRFMELVLDLRGCNQATVKDMKTLWQQINPKLGTLNKAVEDLHQELSKSTQQLDNQISNVLAEVRRMVEHSTDLGRRQQVQQGRWQGSPPQ